ncbi:Dna2 [Cynara cardunculus var. scolymus]|uniref:Dna2 n=1 Tax=Cynara cardunculus var. scolymus TaxID=59895 RepID=A0A103YF88_CYNCS|nr:Dna2 [Cynara cardunculus var. scolymus]
MAPIKKAPHRGSKKSNQIKQQPSQKPSKFGIQHFFEHHTQNCVPQHPQKQPAIAKEFSVDVSSVPERRLDPVASTSTGVVVRQQSDRSFSTGINPRKDLGLGNANNNGDKNPYQGTPIEDLTPVARDDAAGNQLEVSPEFCKSFSQTNQLIHQSQDDGGDEVTWRISPVNERLHALTKNLVEVSMTPSVDFGSVDGHKKVNISEFSNHTNMLAIWVLTKNLNTAVVLRHFCLIIDIEVAWAPKYGLKGVIDASVHVKVTSKANGTNDFIMPLEFKTGKATDGKAAMEHSAQVMLYTLLMSERSDTVERHTTTQLVSYGPSFDHGVRCSDLVGLILRRNELASDILKASTTQQFPPMLQVPNMCKSCRHLNACTFYHKAHNGSIEGSGLDDVYSSLVNHLTTAHCIFLKEWERLIDLEANELEVVRKETWSSHMKNAQASTCLSSIVLDTSDQVPKKNFAQANRFLYRFMRQDLPQLHRRDRTWNARLKLETLVSFSKGLRLPGSSPPKIIHDLCQEVWRIDKDEFTASFVTMRFNLIQMFLQDERSSHLRCMIVDLHVSVQLACIILHMILYYHKGLYTYPRNDRYRQDFYHGPCRESIVDERALILYVLVERKPCMRIFAGIALMLSHTYTKDIKLRLDEAKVVAVTSLGITSPLLSDKKFRCLIGTFDVCVNVCTCGRSLSIAPTCAEAHPQAISALQSQYRMCAPIMELFNALIYANAKLEYISSTSLPSWLKKVIIGSGSTQTNLLHGLEVKDCKKIIDKLSCQGIQGEDIGVITPYKSQANLIKQHVTQSLEIHTIEKYQDKDCILVSFVTSSNNPKNYKSSLLGDCWCF